MKTLNIIKSVIAAILCAVLMLGSGLDALAKTQSEINSEISALEEKSKKIESEINSLKSKKADQSAIKSALEQKVANTQQQIAVCTSKISKYQSEIDEFEADIKKKNNEMESQIFQFKQRIRTIYMSNNGSEMLVILGSKDFSDYLALTELSQRVSAHDGAIVDAIIKLVNEINAAKESVKVKAAEQAEYKKILDEKKAELSSQVSEVNSTISEINSETGDLQSQNAAYEKAIDSLESELKKLTTKAMLSNLDFGSGIFAWPVPGYRGITSYFGQRWGRLHGGIDISGSNITGAPIIAAADGQVLTASFNNGGYGYYVMIDHGKKDGKSYVTLYGHMSSIATSAGAMVKKGSVIGYVGSTGRSTGPHCHFEIRINGSRVDPYPYLTGSVK